MENLTKDELLYYTIAGSHNQKLLENVVTTLNSFIQNGETIYLIHEDGSYTKLDKAIVNTATLGFVKRKENNNDR